MSMITIDREGQPRIPFLQPTMQLTRRQLRLFDEACAGLHRHTRICLNHVVAAQQHLASRTNGELPGVPLSQAFFRQHFRQAEWEELVDRGVVEVAAPDRHEGLAREFWGESEWLAGFAEAARAEVRDGSPELYDAVTGARSSRRARSRLTGPTVPRTASLVTDAARVVRRSLFNDNEVRAHLDERLATFQAESGERERSRALRRLLHDTSCYRALYHAGAERFKGGPLAVYDPPYTPQRNGRLTEIGGGLQGASRAMKERARRGVAGCQNWDLRRAQGRFCLLLMERAGLERDQVREFVTGSNDELAERVGLSVEQWKSGFYALVMGARVPSPKQLPFSDGSLVAVFRDQLDPSDVESAYEVFFEATRGLRREIDAWHDHVVDVWAPDNVRGGRREILSNAAGVNRAARSLGFRGQRYRAKQLMPPFLLQGLEASVVHRIALLGGVYGYEVWSHEHDGLVTRGEIPAEAVERAAEEAGVPMWAAELVQKPFV